ncbi:MAG: sugar ABC transporter permease [Chloroflexi bacterium]|nr:sugar ABC transporter permease [Chloroflexota bacterium]
MTTPIAGQGQSVRHRATDRTWRRVGEISLGYAMLAPAILLMIAFEYFPIAYGLYISSCDWRLDCVRVIGLDNYIRALTDPEMWQALLVTATYSLLAVPLQLGLGLVIAYLLFQKVRGREAMRVMSFLPYVTPTVAAAAVWSYLYSPDKGLFNDILDLFGIQGPRWLGEATGIFQLMARGAGVTLPAWAAGPSLALVSLVIFTTWAFVGYSITIFLAGLGNIPGQLYDAARVDGASGWAVFRNITLPLLSPTTYFLLVIAVIGTFKAFNHIYVMTLGGPGSATTTMSIYIFKQLFEFNRYGYSAALSVLLFLVILALTIVQNRIAASRVVYD